jgi:pseudaminic acid biosynthesis-associated methylase
MTHPTDQWAGNMGDDYTRRQHLTVNARKAWLERALQWADTYSIKSAMELGANIGDNLWALAQVLPAAKRIGVEVNEDACKQLQDICEAHHDTIADAWVLHNLRADLVMTRGVLIHIPPSEIEEHYDFIHEMSRRYILLAEYYNPTPMEIEYRGQMGLLWKRDFAGEMMDRYPGLKLLDYGFVYHRDPSHPQDDITWFLMEKGA